MNRAMSSSRKVSVSLTRRAHRVAPGAGVGPRDDQALDDEPVRRLDEQDVAASRAGRGRRRWSGRPPRSPGAGCPRRSACGSILRQEPVVRSSSPRSFARRSLARKIPVAASVTSAPVTSKATTIVAGSGEAVPVTEVHRLPGPPIAGRAAREDRVADALDPPGQRASPARAPGRGSGRTASGKTAPLTRKRAPGDAPPGSATTPAASGGRSPRAGRRWRVIEARPRTMTTASSGQTTAPGSNGTPRRRTPNGDRDDRAHRPDADARDAAAQQDDQEVARADVDVLEHPVALAIVEDRPGEPGDAGQDERPERRPDDDERAVRGVRAAADDVEDDDEDQGRRPRASRPSR